MLVDVLLSLCRGSEAGVLLPMHLLLFRKPGAKPEPEAKIA